MGKQKNQKQLDFLFLQENIKKGQNKFYNDLNVKYITKNKLFWKTVKPYLMEETSKVERIPLNANEEKHLFKT